MLKRLFILVCICQAVVAMDSIQDFSQRHGRSNSGSQTLAPLPYPSCQATDNRLKDKDKNMDNDKDKLSTSQSDCQETDNRLNNNGNDKLYNNPNRFVETIRTVMSYDMGRNEMDRLYRCLPH